MILPPTCSDNGDPSRDFLWAKDGKGQSQFNSPHHLDLTWNKTVNYQNDKAGNKFLTAANLSQGIAKCVTVMCIQKYRNDYKKLKSLDSSGDPTVMYGLGQKEKILIDDYLTFVNQHYGIKMKSK